ncbi:MAG: LysR family transcriptional regulator, partial [Eubacterium sp.]|nr:LysR family transcriptional regulator [Eubacterium sp.]
MIDNLNLYRVFLAVAETGSISRAAELLFISQPAVSKSIINLESALSVHLIDRSSRGTTLTEQGKVLYEHLRPAFDGIRTAEDEIRQGNELGIGELRIGASTSLCRNILLGYLSRFIREYPHIKVSLVCHSTLTTVKQLEEGRIDLGLICETILPERLSYHPLQEIHDIFVVNPSYLEHLYIREQAAERETSNPWFFAGNITNLLSQQQISDASSEPLTQMPSTEILEKCNLLLLEQG